MGAFNIAQIPIPGETILLVTAGRPRYGQLRTTHKLPKKIAQQFEYSHSGPLSQMQIADGIHPCHIFFRWYRLGSAPPFLPKVLRHA